MEDINNNLLEFVTAKLSSIHVKFEVHHFQSGAFMIDVWIKSDFYVIQVKDGKIGISLINEPDLSVVPDSGYVELEEFTVMFANILSNYNLN